MSSKGEFRMWTGEVEPGFQEVLCAVTPNWQISKHLCCEGQTPCRRWQRVCVEQYYCPGGRVGVVAPACTLLHPLSLWSLPCWLLPPPALFIPAVRNLVQLSDWRIFLTQGIGQCPLVQALNCIPALGGSTARCWQLSHSPLDVFLLTRAACVDFLIPPCVLWLFPEPDLVTAPFSTIVSLVDVGLLCRKTSFLFLMGIFFFFPGE